MPTAPLPPGAAGDGRCPSCGRPLDRKAVVCIGCGFNRRTGASTSIEHRGPTAREGVLGFLRDVVWDRVLSSFGLGILGVAFFGAFAWLARGDADWVRAYAVSAFAALLVISILIVFALVQSGDLLDVLFFSFRTGWFLFDSSTDGRLKTCFVVAVIATGLILPLRTTLPPSGAISPGAASGSP